MKFKSFFESKLLNEFVVYHGTDTNSAKDIINNGIDMSKSDLGYFGRGFYTTPNESLAKSNYADFADDEDAPGVVLGFNVSPDAKLLDLRNEEDWITYRDAEYRGRKITDLRHASDFDAIMRSLDIDGLYDNSFQGWVFYNPEVLTLIDSSVEPINEESNTIYPLYHVSNERFEQFDSYKGAQGITWFSRTPIRQEDLKGASINTSKPVYVYVCSAQVSKIAGWGEYDKYTLDEIQQLGFDAMQLDDNFVVFDSDQIVIREVEEMDMGDES